MKSVHFGDVFCYQKLSNLMILTTYSVAVVEKGNFLAAAGLLHPTPVIQSSL